MSGGGAINLNFAKGGKNIRVGYMGHATDAGFRSNTSNRHNLISPDNRTGALDQYERKAQSMSQYGRELFTRGLHKSAGEKLRRQKGLSQATEQINSEVSKTMNTVIDIKNLKESFANTKNTHNTSELIKQTTKEINTLTAHLKRVVISADDLHHQVYDRQPETIEIYENISLHLKLRLREKTPPCSIKF